VEDNMIQAN